MDPFEMRLKSLPLRQPSESFGRPETLARLQETRDRPPTILQELIAMPWTSKTAVLVGLAALGIVLYLAVAGPASSSVAFAQVAEKLRSAQTLSFDSVITFGADKAKQQQSRTYFMVPGKSRHEMRSAQEEGFVVMDVPVGKALMVSTTQKTAMVSTIKGGAGRDMAKKEIDAIRSLADKDSRPLGEKELDGVRVKGYEITSEIETTTVWANAETGDPVRIEVEMKNSPLGPVRDVMTNFHLDAKLDPAMFSVDPPQGYKVTPFLPIDLHASPASHMAGLLEIYARHMEGEFPPRLEDAIKSLGAKLAKANPEAQLSEDQMKAALHGGGVFGVILRAKAGERWQYYPGVKLGEKDRIVFWYLDAKSNTYSAVYGDLRVEKVAKDRLPPDGGDSQ